MKIRKKRLVLWIPGIIVLLVLVFLLTGHKKKQGYIFSTVEVSQGAISNEITATGTIQALKTVDVGTQVSGVINKIYVDFNSNVRKGQLMAEIDKTPLIASVEDAQASLDDAGAELTYHEVNYRRIKSLYDKQLVAQSDYDQATYNYTKAQAGMKVAQAKYDKAKVNLEYASILSPIDGVVLNRAVNEGQTVAASFNTPTLFSIANDLTQMQVEANIDEADIGQIREGQRVEFTVDAYPDDNFTGEVTQVRLQPVTVSNVTTYTVIIRAANPKNKLMPGMTASIVVFVEENPQALLIPSKALRFKPDSNELKAYFASLPPDERPARDHAKALNPLQGSRNKRIAPASIVWIRKGSNIYPQPIEIGINDGIHAEVLNGLHEGDAIVLSMESTGKVKTSHKENTNNPFIPKPPSRKR